MTAAPPNDASIHDESVLWRRIPPWHIIYDENLGRWRPSSSAFADDPDGQSMSVVLAEAVGGRSGAEILTGHEGFALAAVSVGVVRACGLGVVRDPLESEPAHALVVGPKPKAVQRRLAKAAAWVVPPPPRA